MDQKQLETRLAGLSLGGVRYFERLGSTNDEAAVWAEEGAPDMALVAADEQTAGRGRSGRKWITSPSSSLAFSVILRLTEQERKDSSLSRLTALGALACTDALASRYGLPALIKWPNDVLIRGRKLAGVLAEARWQGEELTAVILGIGMNVAAKAAWEAAQRDVHLRFPVTSVEGELGRPVDRLELLYIILERLIAWRVRLVSPLYLQAWEERLAFRGEWVYIFPGEGRSREGLISGEQEFSPAQEAEILGLAPDGCLRLRTRSGNALTVRVGEVQLSPLSH